MKKEYCKPDVFVESYRLAQSIADSCGIDPAAPGTLGKPTHGNPSVCGWDVGGLIIWTSNGVCNIIADENEEVDGSCYNAPSGSIRLFAS